MVVLVILFVVLEVVLVVLEVVLQLLLLQLLLLQLLLLQLHVLLKLRSPPGGERGLKRYRGTVLGLSEPSNVTGVAFWGSLTAQTLQG